jgi:hypothetical protein
MTESKFEFKTFISNKKREFNYLIYIIIHFAIISGKKFWNLFHLQPMRDQKVSANDFDFFFII